MTEKSKLELLIDQLVNEKTFNLDAMSGIQKIKDQVVLQESRIAQLLADLTLSNKINEELKRNIDTLDRQVTAWKKREESLATGEKRLNDIERERAVAVARAETFDKCFDKVFANRQLRESVIESGNRAVPGGGSSGSYATTMPENSSVMRTIDEM